MKSTYTSLIQSKFFNAAFNSAIFDGPIRIYFAQPFESLALKIYFTLQQSLSEGLNKAKDVHKRDGRNILIMLYPSNDSFQMSFDRSDEFIVLDELEGDELIGINGPFEDAKLDEVLEVVGKVIGNWKTSPAPLAEATA